MIVLKEGECGGKRFRATFEEHIYFDYIAGRECVHYKGADAEKFSVVQVVCYH